MLFVRPHPAIVSSDNNHSNYSSHNSNNNHSSSSTSSLYFLTYHQQPQHFNHTFNQHENELTIFRHTGVTADFLDFFHLGEADIYNVSSVHVWKHFQFSSDPLPDILTKHLLLPTKPTFVFYDNQTDIHWLLQGNIRRRLMCNTREQISLTIDFFNSTFLTSTNHHHSSSIHRSPFYLDYLELFATGKVLPNIFYEKSLFRLSSERAVYVTMNKKKRRVDSADIMNKHGWSFDQVLVLDAKEYGEDFNLLETGPDLTD